MADLIGNGVPRPCELFGRAAGVLKAVVTDGNGNMNTSGATSSVDVVGNTIPWPVMLYGRAPNGQLQAATTDGTGKLNVT